MTLKTVAQTSLDFLLVQNSTLSAIEMECALEDLGHRVTHVAVTPEAAMAQLESARCDAVIFDALLVGLPAYAIARKAADLGLPAVVTSEYPENFVRVLGFDQPYLAKPCQPREVAALARTFSRREAATAA